MNITRVTLYHYNILLKAPITISLGTIEAARNLLVKIETDEGLTGWGEGSPFWMIVGETQASGWAVAQDLAKLLLGKNALHIEGHTRAMLRYVTGHSTTRSMFDMALYDLAAQRAGMPLYQFLGGANRPLVTDETIYLNDPDRMADDARRMAANGAEAIKIKLGTSAQADLDRLAAIRQVIPYELPIRLDANQGWDVPTARTVLTAVADWNVQYCEQPLRRPDVAGLRHLRSRVNIPIMADESVFDAMDALRLVREEAVDYLNIKLSKSGGIREALHINAIAEAAGMACMIGCMSESRLGLTAKAHVAAARQNIRFCDLDACFEHAEDPVLGGITYDGYRITLPNVPGLGAEPNPAFLAGCEQLLVQ
jgi:L-Ala-D/L-Glu epimerase